jgi:hypothetical protein
MFRWSQKVKKNKTRIRKKNKVTSNILEKSKNKDDK